MEATFDVVLYVVSTDLELVHEARVVGARTSCENRGHDIILVKREAHIRDGDIVVVECQGSQKIFLFLSYHTFKVLLWTSYTIFYNHHVW